MSDPLDNPTTGSATQLKKNRRVILGIFGIPALVIVFSTVLYYMVEAKSINLGTVNNGELVVPPMEFLKLELNTLDGQPFDYSKPEPKWAFVVIGDQQCTDGCERALYVARQSITALAKKMDRVRLIFVTSDGQISEQLAQRFDQEYRGMDIVTQTPVAIRNFFSDSTLIDNPLASSQFYVVDPRGWLMMHYSLASLDQDAINSLGKAVVRDMKRLIN